MTVEATNIGAAELPFGYGAHPYLTVGEATVDEVAVTVPAASYLEVDDRLLPTKISPVDGTSTTCAEVLSWDRRAWTPR